MGFFLVPAMLFYSGHQIGLVGTLFMPARTAPLLPSITVLGILLSVGAAGVAGAGVYYLSCSAKLKSVRNQAANSGWIRNGARAAGVAVPLSVLLLTWAGRAYPPAPAAPDASALPSERMAGHIRRAVDGDTYEILSACRRYRVRLAGIDAPETGSASGKAARAWAEARFANESVTWEAVGLGRYGRPIGNVYLGDGTFLNEETVREGYASANLRYPGEYHDRFLELEAAARAARVGIWGAPSEPPARAAPSRSPPGEPLLPPEVAPWDDNGNGRITCAEARRHGIAPVRRGHAAYPYMRDANRDGIVCN